MTKAGAFLFEVVSIGSTFPAFSHFSSMSHKTDKNHAIIILEKQEQYRRLYHVNK